MKPPNSSRTLRNELFESEGIYQADSTSLAVPPSPSPCKSRASGGTTQSSLPGEPKKEGNQEGASDTESQHTPSLVANEAEANLDADLSRDAAYVAILGWLPPELHAAAVASEMRQRGAGAALVLEAYRTRKEAA
jgi:hypothetical protein